MMKSSSIKSFLIRRDMKICQICLRPLSTFWHQPVITSSNLVHKTFLKSPASGLVKTSIRMKHDDRSTMPWDHKKKEGGGWTQRKTPVIEIKDGQYNVHSLAKLMSKSIDEVKTAMDVLEFKHVTESNASAICGELKFRVKRAQVNDFKGHKNIILPIVPGKVVIPRPPVVTIMGHVDHGKTTILDSLRKSEIVKQEFGGITQHIGAFVVSLDSPGKMVNLNALNESSSKSGPQSNSQTTVKASKEKSIKNLVTFLDTPGHAAFHAMRQRGANVTDIVVLVVAADDGVMDQTIESIKFAKNSNVPIVIAINKMDKVNKNDTKIFDKLKRGLMTEGIVLEEDGGDYQSVKVSGLTGEGLHQLKEAILAQAELLELMSTSDGTVTGTVIESLLDARRGKLATILIKTGTLKRGDFIVAGKTHYAKVRSMFDEWGKVINYVGPGFPVQVIGWKETIPDAGDIVLSTETESVAKDYVKHQLAKEKEEKFLLDSAEYEKNKQEHLKAYKEFQEMKRSSESRWAKYWTMGKKEARKKESNIDLDEDRKINLILKADVNGSLEVLLDVMESYPNEREYIKVNIVHFGVGPVTETDLELASAFPNTYIYGFNVKNDPKLVAETKQLGVPLKSYNVIYHLVDDLKKEISAKLPDAEVEVVQGEATVQQEFLINEKKNKRPIAGSRCTKGTLKKADDHFYKLIRGDSVIVDRMKIVTMKHLKDDVKEVKNGVECGLRFEVVSTDINEETNEEVVTTEDVRFKPGDKIVCYTLKKVKQITKWTPPGF